MGRRRRRSDGCAGPPCTPYSHDRRCSDGARPAPDRRPRWHGTPSRSPSWSSCASATPPPHDLAAISAIYNATIPTTTAAWTEQPESLADRQAWFAHQQAAGNATLVADGRRAPSSASRPTATSGTRRSGPATATSSSSPSTSPRPHWGTGVGRALIAELVDRARAAGKTQIVAGIDGDNEASIRFHAPARLPRGRPDAADRRQVRPPARPGADATIDGGTRHSPVKTGSRLARNAAWPSGSRRCGSTPRRARRPRSCRGRSPPSAASCTAALHARDRERGVAGDLLGELGHRRRASSSTGTTRLTSPATRASSDEKRRAE